MDLWGRIEANGHSKRQRRTVVNKMLSPRFNQQHKQKQKTIDLHLEHPETVADSVPIADNNSIFEAENECEMETDWQNELNDDVVNLTVPEVVHDRNLIFAQDLAHWSVTHAIRRDALDELLSLSNESTELNLPKDARTILKTPQQKQDVAEMDLVGNIGIMD